MRCKTMPLEQNNATHTTQIISFESLIVEQLNTCQSMPTGYTQPCGMYVQIISLDLEQYHRIGNIAACMHAMIYTFLYRPVDISWASVSAFLGPLSKNSAAEVDCSVTGP